MLPQITDALAVLERTPSVLDAQLRDLPDPWLRCREGEGTWNAFDVVGHLIHGEKTDWIPRLRIILEEGKGRAFEPFDRFAQLDSDRGRSIGELLDEFASLRRTNLATLRDLELQAEDLDREGLHPELGVVSLRQLLSTWMVHDLGHLGQIARVMAKRYADRVGPWRAYLPVLGDRSPPEG